jgi:hypothetical protein
METTETKKNKSDSSKDSERRRPNRSYPQNGWHPFGNAIILISIIVAILIAFWFVL